MNDVTKHRKATAKRVEKKHACPFCDARFPFPNKLRLHIKSNHSLANICELCPERFNRFNELRTHMRRTHQIIHQCHLCAYSSSVKAELKKHVIKCHENGVRCTVDGCVAIVAYNRLRRHIKEAHCSSLQSNLIADDQILDELLEPESKFTQDFPTEMKFSSATEGSVAMNAFSGIKFVNKHANLPLDKMQGPTSSCISSKALSLRRLIFTVQRDEATENDCGYCYDGIESGKAIKVERDGNFCRQKSLETATQLDVLKMKDQTISEKTFNCGYECQKCGKIFCDVYRSRRHWNRVHLKRYEERVRSKKYGCKISGCTQHFSCPSKLRDHISAVHSEKAQFDCKTCNRKFHSRASFAIHLRRYHLVSIRDVPHGFTDRTDVSPNNVSDEICVTVQNTESKTKVIATKSILTKK